MKKTLIITLLSFIGFKGVAQSGQDTRFEYKRDNGVSTLGNGGIGSTLGITYLPLTSTITPYYENKIDTVMCLMMVTDTSRPFFVSHIKVDTSEDSFVISLDSTISDTVYNNPDLTVKTIVGYNVRKTYDVIYYDHNYTPLYTHLEYLDDKKQPLSKNIIVWQSINQK